MSNQNINMIKLRYCFIVLILCACSISTRHQKYSQNEFCSEIISDSLLSQIPEIQLSEFELNNTSNQEIKHTRICLTQNQLNYFFTEKEQKENFDYFSETKMYFFGKKKLENDKMAIFIFLDTDYLGFYLYCAIINKSGQFADKFLAAYIDIDANYALKGNGLFLNDSVYKLMENKFEYIDNEHTIATNDSSIKIIEIKKEKIYIQEDIKFPTDTIIEN
ncbi:MAG: hypothetical protein LBN23_08655 [Paludibacter sp.]|jgi:hypothetical protein|nr:hypothetical protein [Paludibacter sp.]